MKSYFLSYSRADELFALRLADDLIAAGVSLWVDQYDIRAMEHWDRAVEAAVHGCEGMIVILSPRSVASPNVADEVSVAIDRSKLVIPVMIERCTMPLRMTRMQYVDATTDYHRALKRCLSELSSAAARSSSSQTIPSSPQIAASKLPRETLDKARLKLTAIMGPIASRLVDRAADHAETAAAFHALLAFNISNDTERARFLDSVAEASAATDMPSETPLMMGRKPRVIDTERLTEALTLSLGPIAAHLVDREVRKGGSAEDLNQRLSEFIPSPRERDAFFRHIAKH